MEIISIPLSGQLEHGDNTGVQRIIRPGEVQIMSAGEAWFSLGKLDTGYNGNYKLHDAANGVYAFVIEGEVTVNDHKLSRRDGLGTWETDTISITATTDAEILLIEVPMY